ncbi:MAG: hypothetical protein QW728_04825, partial [Thermoplasmata archaeon]
DELAKLREFLYENGVISGVLLSCIFYFLLWWGLLHTMLVIGKHFEEKRRLEEKKGSTDKPAGKDADGGPQIRDNSKQEGNEFKGKQDENPEKHKEPEKNMSKSMYYGIRKWLVLIPLFSPFLSIWTLLIIQHFVEEKSSTERWKLKAVDRASYLLVVLTIILLLVMLIMS